MDIAYYRVSSDSQSIAAQRSAMGGRYDVEFSDEGVSGTVLAMDRPGFAAMMRVLQAGDTVHVYAIDRLGRDAIDVQSTARDLINMGVILNVKGLGIISKGAGEIILAVLSQVAAMERERILERTKGGIELAKECIKATGKTHNGKGAFGAKKVVDDAAINAYRAQGHSVVQTAKHFGCTPSTVYRVAAQ